MKETIYIGTDFGAIPLKPKEGFAFEQEPYVVLYNKSMQKYYVANVVSLIDGIAYATFTKKVTNKMFPGSYSLEIYDDDSKSTLLKRVCLYADATECAASPLAKAQ